MTPRLAHRKSDLPPLRVHHLFYFLAVAAVAAAMHRGVKPFSGPQTLARELAEMTYWLGAALGASLWALGASSCTRGWRFLVQPGPWLVAASLVETGYLARLATAFESLLLGRPGPLAAALREHWHVHYWSLAPLAIVGLLLLGMAALPSRRTAFGPLWRVLLALLAVQVLACVFVGPWTTDLGRWQGWRLSTWEARSRRGRGRRRRGDRPRSHTRPPPPLVSLAQRGAVDRDAARAESRAQRLTATAFWTFQASFVKLIRMSTTNYQFVPFEGFSPVSTLGPYRAADYWKLPEGAPVELMRGEFVMSPAPRTAHQIIVGQLFLVLSRAELKGGGLTIMSPADVILSDNTILQPDALYIAKHRRGMVGDRINGPPDLVVEVLSMGAERRDRVQKLDLYAQYGVAEFWIVDPKAQLIEFLLLENGRYVVTQSVAGRYQSSRLPEVEIDLATFWRDVADRTPQG